MFSINYHQIQQHIRDGNVDRCSRNLLLCLYQSILAWLNIGGVAAVNSSNTALLVRTSYKVKIHRSFLRSYYVFDPPDDTSDYITNQKTRGLNVKEMDLTTS